MLYLITIMFILALIGGLTLRLVSNRIKPKHRLLKRNYKLFYTCSFILYVSLLVLTYSQYVNNNHALSDSTNLAIFIAWFLVIIIGSPITYLAFKDKSLRNINNKIVSALTVVTYALPFIYLVLSILAFRHHTW
jgi:cytochrome c biogenesis factor